MQALQPYVAGTDDIRVLAWPRVLLVAGVVLR
jgi:hypothetical protein